MLRGSPLPSRLVGLWGSVVSSLSGVRGGAPAEIEFYTVSMPKKPSGDTYCTEFSQ